MGEGLTVGVGVEFTLDWIVLTTIEPTLIIAVATTMKTGMRAGMNLT